VSLSLPRHAHEADAIAFLQEKEAWVRKHLEAQPASVVIRPGATLPLEGQMHLVAAIKTGRARIQADHLLLPGDEAAMGVKAKALLTQMARIRLTEASEAYAATLGRRFGRITLRDTRSRWGSCTSEGNLMYSWRLIMAPPDVLDYVAAHEVSHLVEMNHSPAFWVTVARLMPGFAEPRKWLRQNGASLHRYQF
jgi:predicted metal-dependent hydrolase